MRRRFRRQASTAGAVAIALFLLVSLWAGGAAGGGGAGGGSGGGTGSGHGTGTGSGQGPGSGGPSDGTVISEGAGESSGATTGTGQELESGGAPAAPEANATAPVAPPFKVGFTPVTEETSTRAAAPPANPSGAAGAPGASGGGGGPGPVFMGVKGRGSRVVYVLDKSGSMQGDRFVNARFDLRMSLRALPRDSSFCVIFFDQNTLPMPDKKLIKATDANKTYAEKWFDQVMPGGGTDPTEALLMALAMEPDTIFLMSDGVFPSSAADAVREANAKRASICTIAFHERQGEKVLERIARENEGTYRFVPPPGQPAGP